MVPPGKELKICLDVGNKSKRREIKVKEEK